MQTIENVLIIIFLILVNAVIVAAEIALVSIRKSRIDTLVRQGNRNAVLVRTALDNLQDYIIITQLGVTIVSLSLGWQGERIFSSLIDSLFNGFWGKQLIHGGLITFISLIILTITHLLFGELVPKGLAIRRPESFILFLIKPLTLLVKLTHPLIQIINRTVNIIIKALGMHRNVQSFHYSNDEIRTILQDNVSKKLLSINEYELINNVMQLKKIRLKQVMISKKKIVGFEINSSISAVREEIIRKKTYFNRYPVFKNNINKIVGFIHVHEILQNQTVANGNKQLWQAKIVKPVIYCTEISRPDELLLKMHREHVYVAIITNKFNETIGMIALADLLNQWLLKLK